MTARWLLVGLVPLAAGCAEYRVAPVSGRVLVDGKPVANLRVAFCPVGSPENPNPGPPSVALTDADGRFTLRTVERDRGALVGPCRVRITAEGPADEEVTNKPPARGARQLPARFNDRTELTFEVPREGTGAADFDVSWK